MENYSFITATQEANTTTEVESTGDGASATIYAELDTTDGAAEETSDADQGHVATLTFVAVRQQRLLLRGRQERLPTEPQYRSG